MGDLFHERVPKSWILSVFGVMVGCPQHTFMILTKRPKRMKEFVDDTISRGITWREGVTGRLPNNIWLGVTAENQEMADERIPILLQIPAAVHFVSVEPMLGPVDLDGNEYICETLIKNRHTIGVYLDWVICGGESGPGARPIHPDCVRLLRDQCIDSGVPFFFKQWGGGKKNGRLIDDRTWDQFPEVAS
jgi:protein gp37